MVEISEVGFLLLIITSMGIHFIIYGIKNYFKFYYNWILLPAISIHLTWTSLDIIDKDNFRELGAFRFFRVIIIVLQFNEARFIIESKFYIPYCTKTVPSQNKINKILIRLHHKVSDKDLKEEIEHCTKLVSRIKELPFSHTKNSHKSKNNREFLINSSVLREHKRLDSYHIQQMIKDKVERHDFEGELLLTSKVKKILQKVGQFKFDIFELSNATNGNELITVSTFLLNRHNLFVACAIDPASYYNFITCIQSRYCEVPYHTKTHGADVSRLAYYYATEHGLMEKGKLSEHDL